MDKIWERYFKPPYKFDFMKKYLFDSDQQMVLQMFSACKDKTLYSVIENILNYKPFDKQDKEFLRVGFVVYEKESAVFSARGWGYLISLGCAGLSAVEAAKVQDSMLDYIIKRLKEGY